MPDALDNHKRWEVLDALLEEEAIDEAQFNYLGQMLGCAAIVDTLGEIPRYVAVGERHGHGAGYWIAFWDDLKAAEKDLTQSVEQVPGVFIRIYDLEEEADVPWRIALG